MRTVLLGWVPAALVLACGVAPAGTYEQWRKLPYPPGRAEYFMDIGLEEGGVLWVTAGTTIAYWDGARFRRPQNVEFISGCYFHPFYGGPDHGLYSLRWRTGGPAMIHRLSDGRAIHLTDIDWNLPHNPQSFYVSRSGKLFTWHKNTLAVWTGRDWEKSEAALDTPRPTIFDNGRSVWFFHAGELYGVEDKGRVTHADLPFEFRSKFSDSRPHVKGTLWGNDRAIFLAYGERGVKAADLAAGKMLDVEPIKEAFGNRNVWDLFTAPDGAVWVLARDDELRGDVFLRIAPDGGVERITAVAGLPLDNHQFWQSPASAMFASDGALWLGLREAPLVRLHDGQVQQFADTGLDLSGCTKLLEDHRGRVYALTSHGVYVTAPESLGSFAGLPEPQKPTVLDDVAWKFDPGEHLWLTSAWLSPDRIALSSARFKGLDLWFLESATGARVATLEIADFEGLSHRFAATGRPDRILLLGSRRPLVVDTSEGGLEQPIDISGDPRIAPVPVDGDFVAPGGGGLVRLDRAGRKQWSCELTGYVQAQLAVYGAFGVVQTRCGSYGGQETACVDLNDGELLWSDATDAYGSGAVFADDAKYMVEADTWLSPPATEGRLICRDVRIGDRRWEYAKPGTISHCPSLDRKTDRLYAVFDRGEVVCLDGPTGKPVWETRLLENPYPAVNRSYDPAWSALALAEGRVLVVDRCRTLHVLRAGDGRREAGFKLTSAFPAARSQVALLCMPRLQGELLLVATERGVAAYRLDRHIP